ncbi:MAG: hypothetical protein U5K54_21980 [Cytophagales bacterium]|nr:hypothetical protein [Cytophagales bacterium]
MGGSDDAFELLQSKSGKTFYIENKIRNLKDLPQRITVHRGDEKIIFKSREDYKKYCLENGRDFNVQSWGVDMDILLEVKVP